MTRQEIASRLDTSREVVARLMRGLVSEGGVSTEYGVISVEDSKNLIAVTKS